MKKKSNALWLKALSWLKVTGIVVAGIVYIPTCAIWASGMWYEIAHNHFEEKFARAYASQEVEEIEVEEIEEEEVVEEVPSF